MSNNVSIENSASKIVLSTAKFYSSYSCIVQQVKWIPNKNGITKKIGKGIDPCGTHDSSMLF